MRVLASDEASSTVAQMRSLLQGGLQEQCDQLNRHCATLSDSNVLDGPIAANFRDNVAPGVQQALTNMLAQLDKLQSQLDALTQNILAAGGAGV